jgi:CHAD domain-containing protein
MTTFKVKKRETAPDGIRRVAHERIEHASGLLRDEDADPIEAVHEARKDTKKLRATLKLVRPVLGEDVYDHENARFRDAARELSDARDAQVRAETVEALIERFGDDAPPGGWWVVRGILAGDGDADGDLGSLRDAAATAIEAGANPVDDWPLSERGYDLLRPGLKRAYKRGRKRYREALDDPSDENLHEFRKRSKDLWYQMKLVRRGWPELMETLADEAHELSDRLGDDHDLVVLTADLNDGFEALTAEQRDHLRALIGRRRAELQEEAFAYGERIFAEQPKRFVERIESYWAAPKI